MFEITDKVRIEDMINRAADDIEGVLKRMPVLEKITLCHKIASPLAWDTLEMADSEMTNWCVERGATSVSDWYDNYEYKATFVKINLCDSVLNVWEAGGIREKINERAKALCYAICGKVPERFDFAGVVSFRLFGDIELSLPDISMEKFFDKKILPLKFCYKALLRRFAPFFSREYVYRKFESNKYIAYLNICNIYEAHFMQKDYNDMLLPEYINCVIKNIAKELIYDQLCAVLNVTGESAECEARYIGEYSVKTEDGSVKLPDKWNVEGDVVLVGCGDHIEIMKKEAYDEKINEIF